MDRSYMELAARALGMPGAERRDPQGVERELMDRWGLTPERWRQVADALLACTPPFDDPIAGPEHPGVRLQRPGPRRKVAYDPGPPPAGGDSGTTGR